MVAVLATEAQAQVECSSANTDGSYTVPTDWPLKPSGVSAGDKFRLLFVTSTTGNARTSTDIATYNTFVQTRAKAGHSAITDSCGDLFKVVGSTSAVDARDNTSTTGTGEAIYWLDGAKLADNYSDFYDDSWDSYERKTETGGTRTDFWVWSGSNQNGTKSSKPLGNNGRITLGGLTSTLAGPIEGLSDALPDSSTIYPFYGLSPVFVVASAAPTDGVTVSESTLALRELHATDSEKTYTVVLDTDPGVAVSITVTVPAANTSEVQVKTGSGAFGSSATLTFTHGNSGNWNEAQTVTVRALNDGNATDTTSFNLTHSLTAASGPYQNITPAPVAVSVTDAGHGVTMSKASVSVAENSDTETYTIVLKSQPGGSVVITPTSSATANATVSGALTFTNSNWSTPQTVTVTGVGAGSATISHSVTTPTTAYPNSTTIDSVAVTVTGDTSPAITISGGNVVTEGTAASFTVSASPAPSGNLTVNLDVSESEDFVASGDEGTDTVTVGTSGTATYTVPTTSDNTDESNGEVKVAVDTGTGYRVSGSNNIATVEIIDNDATSVTLSGTGNVAEDGSDSVDVTVTLGRNLAAGESVTVPLAISGSGITVSDYTIELKSGSSLNTGVTLNTTNPHSASAPAVVFTGHGTNTVQTATLEIRAQQDTDDEGQSEALTVGFGSGDRAVTSNLDRESGTGTAGTTPTGTAAVTITDDDTAGSPGVTIVQSAGSTSVSEDGGTDSYTVVLKTQPTADVTVTLTAGTDVQVSPASLTFTHGNSGNWNIEQTVTVTGVNDDIDNAGDSRTVTIGHAATSTDSNYTITSAGSVIVTVSDDDTAGVSISSNMLTVLESGGRASYTVKLNSQPLGSVVITATSGDMSVVKLDGPDSSTVYTDTEDLTFTTGNWDQAQTVTIEGQSDNIINTQARTETVSHTIKQGNGDGSGYTPGSSIDSVSVTVTDDDSAGLMLSEPSVSIEEGGSGSYTVRLATAPTGTVTVNIASNNTDVTVSPAPLTFNASGNSKLWSTAQTVSVSAGQDADTVDDTATLTHTASGGGYGRVTSSVTVTVNDDDRATTPRPTTPTTGTGTGGGGVPPSASPPVISISGGVGAEEGEVLMYSIISEEPVEQDTEVKIKVEQRGEYTEPVESTVTIKTGEKEAVYEVTTTDDSIDEEDGEVTVTVLSGTGYEVGTSSSATLEVRDNDTAGIRVSEVSLRVSDLGGSVNYGVALTSEPVLEVRVEPRSQNSSVAEASGALVFTAENWREEQMITVTGNESGSTVIEHEVISEDSMYASLESVSEVEVDVQDRKMIKGAGQWLGRFGRTVAERVVEAVTRRMEGERESRVEIAGVHPVEKRPEGIWEEQEQKSLSLEEALLSSSFEVGRKDSAVFWAKASRSSFEGRSKSFRGDGDITMGMGGVDWEGESFLGGIMIIRADGEGEYGNNEVDVYLTGAVPYAGGRITDHLSVWGAAGAGAGEMRVGKQGGRRWSTDIGWRMAAGGIRGDIVVAKREGPGLAFVSDVLWARSESEDLLEDMGVSRIRAGVEGSWIARLSESALFEPRVEAGIRRDGGDAERGIGAELGGGMKLRHTELGITFDIEGRGLVSHEDGGFESRGISASFEWAKDMSEGMGASVALRQDWGEPESGGMESLFYDGPIRGQEVSSNGSRLSAEAEYGFMREGMRQAPYVDYGQWEEGRDYALGWRVSTISSDVSVDVNATRRESEQTDTEHGVGVRLDVRW